MEAWTVEYLPEAKKDRDCLDGSVKVRVNRAIRKVSQNPLPKTEGGYGNPLRDQDSLNLKDLLKIKLRADGVRVVYKLERTGHEMRIVVIGMRADEAVYREAARRRKRHGI